MPELEEQLRRMFDAGDPVTAGDARSAALHRRRVRRARVATAAAAGAVAVLAVVAVVASRRPSTPVRVTTSPAPPSPTTTFPPGPAGALEVRLVLGRTTAVAGQPIPALVLLRNTTKAPITATTCHGTTLADLVQVGLGTEARPFEGAPRVAQAASCADGHSLEIPTGTTTLPVTVRTAPDGCQYPGTSGYPADALEPPCVGAGEPASLIPAALPAGDYAAGAVIDGLSPEGQVVAPAVPVTLLPADGLSIQVEVSRTTARAGTTIQGRVVFTNTTGRAAHWTGCPSGSDWPAVGLADAAIGFPGAEASCLAERTIPVGTSSVPVTVLSQYQECGQSGTSSAEMPPCLSSPTRIPPLPAGSYHVVVDLGGFPAGTTVLDEPVVTLTR